jgi:aryl-alcohol dehydrogenase-like predicted oxidoreductase
MNTLNPPEVHWSRLGLGTGTLASLGRAASVSQIAELLDTMLELGMKVVDTADTYGSGDCEILLGKALLQQRNSFTIVTKAGYRHSDLHGPLRPLNQFIKKGIQRSGSRQCFEPAYLARSLDRSLARLRTSCVDAFLLHDPPLEAVMRDDVLKVCASLRSSGKAGHVGVSSGDPEVLMRAIASRAFDVIQTPAGLGAAASLRTIWSECELQSIHVIGNHVYDPAFLALPGMSHELLMRASSSLLPCSATILCGTRNPAHLRQSLEWACQPLPPTEAHALITASENSTQSPS